MTEIIRRYHIVLPAHVALLLKVLVMLEGTSRSLNPRFDMFSLLLPYQRRLLRRWLSPKRRLRKLQQMFREWRHLGEVLPRSMADILQQLQHGRFEVHLEHKRLHSSINRLVYGLVTSALFLGSALMLSHKVAPLIGNVSLFGLIGLSISLVQAVRLFWSIRNSGRLD
jgi:ubiquinone biosynthesis protein